MATLQETMDAVMSINGALGVAIVDRNGGLTLGSIGDSINLELAASGNVNVLRANQKVMRDLGLKETIEDLLITLSSQYHVIRPVTANPDVYIYVILKREHTNLGMARYELQSIEKRLQI